ncbi:MAG: Inorganic pyrophosphatase [Acidobacteria bacterium]|nr:Inorganic pyrophosphatase [Acidobacteriota bacterium]
MAGDPPGPAGPVGVRSSVVAMPTIRVFIENTAGSNLKHHHDEETLTLLRVERVSGAYPFPYGFVPGTSAPDGDAVDCFVVTARPLQTGDLVACEPFALMEQMEAGVVDHNLLAVLAGEAAPDLAVLAPVLTRSAEQLFAGMPGREVTVGRFLPVGEALAYLEACSPPRPGT